MALWHAWPIPKCCRVRMIDLWQCEGVEPTQDCGRVSHGFVDTELNVRGSKEQGVATQEGDSGFGGSPHPFSGALREKHAHGGHVVTALCLTVARQTVTEFRTAMWLARSKPLNNYVLVCLLFC
jgi:hypothetical protein